MNRFYIVVVLLIAVLSGCEDSPTESTGVSGSPTAVADCCQCSSRGSSDTPSSPVACFPGTTNQSACDQACGNNIGGLMVGSCSDGVRCQ